METGLTISHEWGDEDVVEVQVSASNGSFAGSLKAYLGVGELSEISDLLSGFPVDANDKRDVLFGSASPDVAGGRANLHFYCAERTAMAFVDVRIVADPASFDGGQYARIAVPIEARDLDLFLAALRGLELSKKSAFLPASQRRWRVGQGRPVLSPPFEKTFERGSRE